MKKNSKISNNILFYGCLILILFAPLAVKAVLSFTENVIHSSYRSNTVRISDLDDDGDMDIVSASLTYDEVVWYKNDGSENFTKTAIDATFTDPQMVLPVDLDEDGDEDVVVVAANDGDKLVWYQNDGSENFTENSIDAAANGPFSVDVADIDGDLDLDILISVYTDSDIIWYRNNGSESFTKITIDADESYIDNVDIVDLDDDGDMDFVISGYNVYWYRNNGSESFTRVTASSADTYLSWVQAIDMDDDGDQDIAVTRSDKLFWLENNGSESFTQNVISTDYSSFGQLVASDFDGDGDNDIAVAAADGDGNVLLYNNDGNEIFTLQVVNNSFLKAEHIDVGDIDGDGSNDIVASPSDSWTGDISWFKSALDTTPPSVSDFSPEDDEADVATGTGLSITFNESTGKTGTGYITIYKASDDSIFEQINTATGAVTGSGTATIVIDPTSDFDEQTSYYIQIDAMAISDASGNFYTGISDATTWNFTTADESGPTVSSLSPADNATTAGASDSLVITFSEATDKTGTGYVTIYNAADDSIVEQINTATGSVTGSGTTTITINPDNDFYLSTSYYVKIDAMAFYDASGNSYAGISDSTTWNFTASSGVSSGNARRARLQLIRAIVHNSAPAEPDEAEDVESEHSAAEPETSAELAAQIAERNERLMTQQEQEDELPPDTDTDRFKERVCKRVKRWFYENDKMLIRVNNRLTRRFGWICEYQ
ncbi:VCBS repeat-containing protein [Patescibacteria group bacterium]|nr:VCBS repeat-containing protein [Patescibacteria group bacterium]